MIPASAGFLLTSELTEISSVQLLFQLFLRHQESSMKKTHIILLVFIAISIACLISFMGNVTTYETVASAKQKEGKFVNLIAKLDMNQPLEYDPVKNPNYLTFTAIDTLGNSIKVVYRNTKPTDMEKSERLVLKGKVQDDIFECKDILLKCPSKYKDDMQKAKKNLETTSK
jgi:cytochrome c-type biogenesis protein CcmE